MISEIFPFWSKYWHYILITVVTYLYVTWKNSQIKSDLKKDYDNEAVRKKLSDQKAGIFMIIFRNFYFILT